MMQSASSYDTTKVKETVAQQVAEEQAAEATPNINSNEITTEAPTVAITNSTVDQMRIVESPATTAIPNVVTATPIVPSRATKPRLRQQAYYLTEIEIKTIKRLSYELDIPKSDLVRKFIDEGIARLDQQSDNH